VVEEVPVAEERDPQTLGVPGVRVDAIVGLPVRQRGALPVHRVRQRGEHFIHQRGGQTRCGVRVIDEAQLQLLPPILEALGPPGVYPTSSTNQAS
jgi:hypothetical protein